MCRLHQPLRVDPTLALLPVLLKLGTGLLLGLQLLVGRVADLMQAYSAIAYRVHLDGGSSYGAVGINCLFLTWGVQVRVGEVFISMNFLRCTLVKHREVVQKVLVGGRVAVAHPRNDVMLRLLWRHHVGKGL